METNELPTTTEAHRNAGHDLWVRGGVVECDTCGRLELDTSGSRPGLVAANQNR